MHELLTTWDTMIVNVCYIDSRPAPEQYLEAGWGSGAGGGRLSVYRPAYLLMWPATLFTHTPALSLPAFAII